MPYDKVRKLVEEVLLEVEGKVPQDPEMLFAVADYVAEEELDMAYDESTVLKTVIMQLVGFYYYLKN